MDETAKQNETNSPSISPDNLRLTEPDAKLGYQVFELIERCPPLDTNSVYCNLLQAHHFAATSCAVLTEKGKLVGFVSGYLIPDRPDTLFIWQVAVDSSARGLNLGARMMSHILAREVCEQVKYLETTVTGSNDASAAMFSKLARLLGAPEIEKTILFDQQHHFNGHHDSEVLFRIGPFSAPE